MNRWVVTGLFLLGTILLTNVIPGSSFFRNVDTMVHELGHALATLILSGKVLYIELYANHGGVTYSYITQGWRTIPLSLAGYTTASLFALLLFRLYAKGNLKAGFVLLMGLAVVSLFFIRNPYGALWLIGFIIVNGLFMYVRWEGVRKFYYLLVSFICLEQSVVGPLYLLKLSLTQPGVAGDAANLARSTIIPAFVWALLFVVFSLYCARKAITAFIGRVRSGRAERPSETSRQWGSRY